MKRKITLKKLDFWLLAPYLLLTLLGALTVYSSSSNMGNPNSFLARQLFFVFVSYLAIVLILKTKFFRLLTDASVLKFLLYVNLGFLLLARLAFAAINGAHGWIRMGLFSFQPAETFKLILIFYTAAYMSKHPWNSKRKFYQQTFLRDFSFTLPILASFVMLILMPDIGNFSISLGIFAVVIAASGISAKINAIIATIVVFVFWFLSAILRFLPASFSNNNYQMRRLISFLDPWKNVDSGRQLIYAYYAIANGGLFGAGIGKSLLKKGYLPEANTDFIMAVVFEEFGVIATTLLFIVPLVIIIYRIIIVGVKQEKQFYRLALFGVASWYLFQILVNLGGVVGLLPITGVVFPFISYGGSSMLAFSIVFAFVLRVSFESKKTPQNASNQQMMTRNRSYR